MTRERTQPQQMTATSNAPPPDNPLPATTSGAVVRRLWSGIVVSGAMPTRSTAERRDTKPAAIARSEVLVPGFAQCRVTVLARQ